MRQYKGFLIICTACGRAQSVVEARQDGVDFQCRACGNKLLMRPGEIMRVPSFKKQETQSKKQSETIPKQSNIQKRDLVEEQTKQLQFDFEIEEMKRSDVPLDDWADNILNEYLRRRELLEE